MDQLSKLLFGIYQWWVMSSLIDAEQLMSSSSICQGWLLHLIWTLCQLYTKKWKYIVFWFTQKKLHDPNLGRLRKSPIYQKLSDLSFMVVLFPLSYILVTPSTTQSTDISTNLQERILTNKYIETIHLSIFIWKTVKTYKCWYITV